MSSDSGQAAFNGAVLTLVRVDILQQKISQYALLKDFEMWLTTLKHLKREISPYLKETEYEEINNKIIELDKIKWIVIDEQGRRKVVEELEPKVEGLLDDITVLSQKYMFKAGILMAIKELEEDYD